VSAARRTPRLGRLEPLIGLKLRLAMVQFFEVFFAEFGETGLSPAELSILALLAEQPGLRQVELRRLLRIKRSNMTKLVRALEAKSLIERRASTTDGRTVESFLTADGDAVQRHFIARVFANDEAAAGALTRTERAELLRLLDKLIVARTTGPAPERRQPEVQHG
jgi:DNA-binding MarR family transcriptional regulator